jgi:hypothetical protein
VDGSLICKIDNPNLDPNTAQLFGEDLAGIGDVSDDFVPDFAVGAWQQRVTGIVQGRAFVFSGVDGSLLYPLDPLSPQIDTEFGRSISKVGDIDNDLIADIAVGAHGQDVGGNDRQGQVFLFSGAYESFLYGIDNPEPQANASFGSSIDEVGDINHDSIPDILVDANNQDFDGFESQG